MSPLDGCHMDGSTENQVSILLNGDHRTVEAGSTIADLILSLKMNPKFLAVELNLKVVPRTEHPRTTLAANDQIEIVTLVGGG